MEEEQKKEVEFDISSEKQEASPDKDLKASFLQFHLNIFRFLKEVANIKEGTDYQGTIDGIKKDSDFKGHGIWILIFSILIASIGLNVNSTAVVIGAMLISPLMGPILGIGLSVGTNDWQTLISSVKSFGTMTLVAILTSTLYFFITPLHEVQPELIARTKPTILDVFIAICGGTAGIIAGSRSEKSNVIPGVAIATALMPPLCTAGFGLANGNWNFFFGAFYLFLLNSVFIAISTFLVVRFLRFPIIQFMHAQNERKVRRYMIFFVLVVIIPSGWIFWDVIQESIFRQRAERFVYENVHFEGTEIINQKIQYSDSLKRIELFVIGELISDRIEKNLNGKLPNYGLEEAELKIYQSKDQSSDIAGKLSKEVKAGILEDIYEKNAEELENKDRQIRFLENELVRYKKDSIPFTSIERELKVQYDQLQSFAYARALSANLETDDTDTIPCLLVKWKKDIPERELQEEQDRLAKWLKIRLNLDTVRVLRY